MTFQIPTSTRNWDQDKPYNILPFCKLAVRLSCLLRLNMDTQPQKGRHKTEL